LLLFGDCFVIFKNHILKNVLYHCGVGNPSSMILRMI